MAEQNPPRRPQAVALSYVEGEAAPRVVAKGNGLIADEIIRRAKEAGVYVHESSDLVGLLMQVDVDDRIPPQLYVAIAELLAWLYRVERGEETTPKPVSAAIVAPVSPLPAQTNPAR